MTSAYARTAFVAAAFVLTPISAMAERPTCELSASVHVTLTILPSASVGTRARGRGGNDFVVEGNAGRTLGPADFQIVYRDRRGERLLHDQTEVVPAIAQSGKAGDPDVEITLVF